MELSDHPDPRTRQQYPGRAARMPGRLLGRPQRQGEAQRSAEREDGLSRVGPIDPVPGTGACQGDGNLPRLGRQGGIQCRQCRLAGPTGHLRCGRRRSRRREDSAHLVHRDIGQAATKVALHSGQQSGEQARSQQVLGLRQRIDQRRRDTAAGQQLGGRRRDEGRTDHLDEPAGRQSTGGDPAQPLLRRQAAAGGSVRQDDRDAVVALEPHHLLDQVRGAGQVRPPGWRGDRQVVVPLHPATDVEQPVSDDCRLVRATGDPPGERNRHPQRLWRRRAVNVCHRSRRRSAELHQQLHRGLRSGWPERRIHPALEAPAGLRRQLVPSRRAADRNRAEVRRFDEQRSGVGADLGSGAPHHPSQGKGAAVVGDDEIVGIEPAHLPVEGGQLLAGGGPTNDDAALQRGEVEGMQRLPKLEQDVIGDVDGQRDGAHAAQGQPALQPGRRHRLRIQAGDGTGYVAVAAGHVVDSDRMAPGAGCHADCGQQPRVFVRQAEGGRDLPCHPPHRERIAAIRGHRDIQHLVAQFQQRHNVQPELAVGRKNEDAGVVVPESELAGRADHAVGGVPVSLAGGDPKIAGQDRSGLREGDAVAGREVRRPADHIVHAAAGVNVAEANRLLELGQLLDVDHPADDDAGHVVAVAQDLLDFEAGTDQGGGNLVGRGGEAGQQVTQPGQGYAHVRPPHRREG